MRQPELGIKITELRKAKGLTQAEFADLCDVGKATLQRIENGQVSPRAYTVKTIFAALGAEMPPTTSLPSNLKSKINTKKNVAIFVTTIVGIAIGLFFLLTGKKGENFNPGNLQTSHFTEINTEVPNVPQEVRIVKLVETQDDHIFFDQGTFEDGRLNVSLPEDMLSKFVYTILRRHPNITKSNENARFAIAKLEGYDEQGNLIGRFEYHSSEKEITTLFIYADRDVSLIGIDNSNDIWETALKEGWNKVFLEEIGEGISTLSTAHPGEEMRWSFRKAKDD